ncbi:MAG: hypothetical protein JXR05_12320 [Flavobacteriaceae bacterium]
MSIDDIGRSTPSGLKVNNHAKRLLSEVAKWAKFLSVVGFVGIGLMVVFAFIGEYISASTANSDVFSIEAEGGIITTVLILIFAVIYFFPAYYLYKFSNEMKQALEINDEDSLTRAFRMLSSHYRYIGILAIIFISLYIFSLIIIFAAASV